MEKDSADIVTSASSSRRSINDDTSGADHFHGTSQVARARWTLLRQVLRQKQVDSPEIKQVSVRRFATFDLFTRKNIETQDSSETTDDQWVEYRSVYFPEFSALLRDNLGPLQVNEVLNSFDNTGNVCKLVLVLFYLVLFHFSVSQVAIGADVREVLLSDGNEKSIQSILSSSSLFHCLMCIYRVVRWDCESDISVLEGHFDVVMCADCLFLDQYRACLVDALRRLLQPNGMALVFAPTRGETLRLFCHLAQQTGLYVSQHQEYDPQVMDVHLKVGNLRQCLFLVCKSGIIFSQKW
uniref:Calmodulin-lysine N-methyltransferase n=1 Tax=Mola mola TaxID=94237 RepID=A0A3Q4AXZ2_MOLML